MSDTVEIPPGIIFVTTHGAITSETSQSIVNTAIALERAGVNNIEWRFISNSLVDKARNESAQILVNSQSQWLWFLDADMQWAPNLGELMLTTAFAKDQDAAIIGGWCPLRGEPHLPTIDTGTGTWESIDANQGPIDVIRTGAACVIVKRVVYEKMVYPWYGVRPASRPLDFLYEADGYARQKFDGKNPFAGEKWDQLMGCASDDARSSPAIPNAHGSVGEDSNFCDKAKALGFKIIVQTNAVCNHVDKKLITPEVHGECMKKRLKIEREVLGID